VESQRTPLRQSPTVVTTAAPVAARRRVLPRASRPDHTEGPGPEELVLGRYRLLERLGAGGFGVVWRAHDELLHREVAVKRIWLGPDGDSERATREALAAARLAHPAIVALYEACSVGDAFYLISELIDGDTLARLIAEDQLGDEQIVAIGIALAAALGHAHERGVIHRDIKPQNVLVPRRPGRGSLDAPAAKLTDFGGASLVGEDALTRTGDVLGTLAYMAPEQSEGDHVDEQADLYALSLVLYEAFSGVNPVRGATPAATVRRIGQPLETLARHRRDLPRALTDAIDDALAPVPAARGSLAELAEALREELHEVPPTRVARGRPAGAQTTLLRGWQARPLGPARNPEQRPASPEPETAEGVAPAEPRTYPQRMALPRAAWIAAALLLMGWQAAGGRPGVALLLLAALVPLALLPADPYTRRVGSGWLICALAPILGLAGLAGAFPAAAGQGRRWRDRAIRGAVGYWWLLLAERLLARDLWLGSAAPARNAWEGSIQTAAVHVVGPLLSLGVLLGVLLWAVAAAVLPWIVRGRSAVLDLIAATIWAAALASATPALVSGLAPGAHAQPRGLVLGVLLAGLGAVGARALRGPV